MLLKFEQQFLPSTTAYDAQGRFRVSAYLDLFQTVAGRHAESFGMGQQALNEHNIAWVLAKSRLTVYDSPPIGLDSDVLVVTAPQPHGSLDYIRDYYVYNLDGKLLAKGSGQWLHIDITTRRVVRPKVEYLGEFVDFTAYENTRIDKLPLASEGAPIGTHRVTKSDIDQNGHTNNIKYADMIYNAIGCRDNKTVCECVINYLNESREGDEIALFCESDAKDNSDLFLGMRGETPVFTAKYTYKDL